MSPKHLLHKVMVGMKQNGACQGLSTHPERNRNYVKELVGWEREEKGFGTLSLSHQYPCWPLLPQSLLDPLHCCDKVTISDWGVLMGK